MRGLVLAFLLALLAIVWAFPTNAEVVYDHKAIPWNFQPGQKVTMKKDTNPDLIFQYWFGVKCLEGTQTGDSCTFTTPEKPIEPGAFYLHKKKAGTKL